MFAAITYVPPFSPFQDFKSPVSIKHKPLVLSQNVAVLIPSSFSSSSGVPSSTTPLLAGLGVPQAGRLFSAASTLQVAAGGTPVYINSGTAALAISLYLGKRCGYGTKRLAYKPQNTSCIILAIGTVLLWFGWFGFNGGSAFVANLRAIQACIATNMAASVGGLTWMLWVSFNIL
jgi:hypothetical protein